MTTIAEIAAKIKAEGGALERFVSVPDHAGNRQTIWQDVLGPAAWLELRALFREAAPVPAGTLSAAQWRSLREADESCEPKRRRRR